jgi:hypothetical protein
MIYSPNGFPPLPKELELTTYTAQFPTSDDLLTKVKAYSSYPDELWNDDNWFVPLKQLFKQIDLIFRAKTLKKYFIWSNDEVDVMIDGFFIPLFYEKLLQFYVHQLAFINGELNKMKDPDYIGDKLSSDDRTARTSYSQPTKSGVEWDNDADAPTGKFKRLGDINRTNVIKNITALLNADISIYWTNFFMDFEKFFISQYWVKRHISGW